MAYQIGQIEGQPGEIYDGWSPCHRTLDNQTGG